MTHVKGLAFQPQDFSAAFAGDGAARARLLDRFAECAEPMVAGGADVIVPAGVLPGLLVASERGYAHRPRARSSTAPRSRSRARKCGRSCARSTA